MDLSVHCLRVCRLSEGWGPPFILSAKIWGFLSAWGGREFEGPEQGGGRCVAGSDSGPSVAFKPHFPLAGGRSAAPLLPPLSRDPGILSSSDLLLSYYLQSAIAEGRRKRDSLL